MRLRVSPPMTRAIGAVVTIALFAAALWAIDREVAHVAAAHLSAELLRLDPLRLLGAILATAVGYGILTFYDRLGLAVIDRRLPDRTVAKGAFLSFAISHNVGLGWLSAGAMRQRIYSRHGLDLGAVAQLTLMNSITFFVGAFLLLGGALIIDPSLLTHLLPIAPGLVRASGILLMALTVAYAAACDMVRRPVRIGRVAIRLPGPQVAMMQMLLSCIDLVCAAAALHLALPPSLHLSFPTTLGIYMVALSGSVVTHVPGGLGVFEALMLWSLPTAPRAPLLAGLIAFRLVYYLLPLLIAVAWMAHDGALHIRPLVAKLHRRLAPFVPLIAAATALICGIVLLLSGATPTVDARLHLLRQIVPLPLLELSHLAGSVIGLALVVLAHALYRRYDSAWGAAMLLLGLGAIASLLKGGDWEEALLLTAAAGVLAASRASFFRRGSIWRNIGSPTWVLFALTTVGLSIWIGLSAYSQVAYRNDLWWQVAYQADAPRFLRASVVLIAITLGLLVAHVLHATRQPRSADAISGAVRAAVAVSPDSNANLALLGDKRFLTSRSGQAFLMYQVEGTSWITMGDPVGPKAEWPELIWSFRDLADQHGGRAIFYQVDGAHLDLYADAGLTGRKIGEEARVDLAAFDLNAPGAKSLRAILRRGAREELCLEIVASSDVPALLDDLARVSDDWIAAKGGREKGFSLGFFDPTYLAQFDCAVVRRDKAIIAFANIWRGSDHELSIDLMRYASDAPKGTMSFLITQLIVWGKMQGFAWFNLGMAPLAGLAKHRLAPLWHRIGRFAFRHGGSLYGFEGLREFKQQFQPIWRGRYIACDPAPAAFAKALRDVTRLIARTPTVDQAAPKTMVRRRPLRWARPFVRGAGAVLILGLLTGAVDPPIDAFAPVIGIWQNPKGSVRIATQTCGERLCGWVVWASDDAQKDARNGGSRQLIGTQLFQDFHADRPGRWRGRVFVPDRRRSFAGTLSLLNSETLRVRGCVLGGLFCKTQIWHRVPAATADEPGKTADRP